jgi:hypothetical protein
MNDESSLVILNKKTVKLCKIWYNFSQQIN